jgi:hypothetical protein
MNRLAVFVLFLFDVGAKLGVAIGMIFVNISMWKHPGIGVAFFSVGSLLFMPIGINLPNGKTIGLSARPSR